MGFCRNMTGAFFPLVTPAMYANLGIQRAGALTAGKSRPDAIEHCLHRHCGLTDNVPVRRYRDAAFTDSVRPLPIRSSIASAVVFRSTDSGEQTGI